MRRRCMAIALGLFCISLLSLIQYHLSLLHRNSGSKPAEEVDSWKRRCSQLIMLPQPGLNSSLSSLSKLTRTALPIASNSTPAEQLESQIISWPPVISKSARLSTICADKTCQAAYHRHLLQPGVYPIPPVRHILWKSQRVSAYFANQLQTWANIHPNWTYVLWQDTDLEPFVAKHFPGLLGKFKSLKEQIFKVDMIRYLILFKFGGVYADLDYRLVRSLDPFRRYPAVVTREPDPHSLQFLGPSWPIKPLASPAFLMSAPGHVFLSSVMQQLEAKGRTWYSVAGPFGLTEFMERYGRLFPVVNSALEAVYLPPANSFYPYAKNRLSSTRIPYVQQRLKTLRKVCSDLAASKDPAKVRLRQESRLTQYCKDVDNLDPITDTSKPVVAIHDQDKTGSIWYGGGLKFYNDNLTDCGKIFRNLQLANGLY